MAVNGGKASGVARAKNKTFREALKWYLDMTIDPRDKGEEELLEKFPNLTNRDYLAIASVETATRDRDVRAMVFVRDTMGEAPAQLIGMEQDKPFNITITTVEQTT